MTDTDCTILCHRFSETVALAQFQLDLAQHQTAHRSPCNVHLGSISYLLRIGWVQAPTLYNMGEEPAWRSRHGHELPLSGKNYGLRQSRHFKRFTHCIRDHVDVDSVKRPLFITNTLGSCSIHLNPFEHTGPKRSAFHVPAPSLSSPMSLYSPLKWQRMTCSTPSFIPAYTADLGWNCATASLGLLLFHILHVETF